MLEPVPFLLSPRTDYEFQFGKAVLLTDCELGILLSALAESNIQRDDDGVVTVLFQKLFGALDENPPYEGRT